MAASKKFLLTNSVIDDHKEIVHPLDYSFKAMSDFTDILREKPRNREKGSAVLDLDDEELSEGSTVDLVKSKSPALKLNNNMLSRWEGFWDTIETVFMDPANTMQWLDLSFNDIKTIDQVLLELPNLTMLYLHGNNIRRAAEVDKLSELSRLKSLTLHGNPIESLDGYRMCILAKIPQLNHLDFSAVTKQDRISIEIWCKPIRSGSKSISPRQDTRT